MKDNIRFLRKEYVSKTLFSKTKYYIYAVLVPQDQIISNKLVFTYTYTSEAWYDLISGESIIPDLKDNMLILFGNLGELFENIKYLFPRYIDRPILVINKENDLGLPKKYGAGYVELMIPKNNDKIDIKNLLIINMEDKESSKLIEGINSNDYNIIPLDPKLDLETIIEEIKYDRYNSEIKKEVVQKD